ncbi:MAG: hypothetical protein AAF280_01660 [Pseudomonadota bacterium]
MKEDSIAGHTALDVDMPGRPAASFLANGYHDRQTSRDVETNAFKCGVDTVQFGGKGVGGNAVAKVGAKIEGKNIVAASDTDANGNGIADAEDAADAFIFAAREARSTELLGVKGSGESGTWNQVAADNNAIASRDMFTFNPEGVELGQDPEIEFNQVIIEEFGWSVLVGGHGVGGKAVAKFNSKEEAPAFALCRSADRSALHGCTVLSLSSRFKTKKAGPKVRLSF